MARSRASATESAWQSSRGPKAGLRKSKIAQPPILAPRLYAGDPATKRIEHRDDYEPPKVHAGQRNAVSLRKKWKKCTDLVCRETLGYGQHYTERVNEIEMHDIERKWDAPEHHECVFDPPVEAVSERTQHRCGTERHQQELKARRVLGCI